MVNPRYPGRPALGTRLNMQHREHCLRALGEALDKGATREELEKLCGMNRLAVAVRPKRASEGVDAAVMTRSVAYPEERWDGPLYRVPYSSGVEMRAAFLRSQGEAFKQSEVSRVTVTWVPVTWVRLAARKPKGVA